MQSTLFTELTVSEEANLSGGKSNKVVVKNIKGGTVKDVTNTTSADVIIGDITVDD
ncbi:hypothetical protein [Nostoc sp. NMS8]|uniref:hypothetical protein n=1 Tax=Nostoc sp. NMS8 TaxID=2815392 RepID=UPI0025E053E9|nr:hypothetical protein [Nostoc sp. NMS8]MBN3958228.1 hypothetical protein [Nostoc sp. NMS8]